MKKISLLCLALFIFVSGEAAQKDANATVSAPKILPAGEKTQTEPKNLAPAKSAANATEAPQHIGPLNSIAAKGSGEAENLNGEKKSDNAANPGIVKKSSNSTAAKISTASPRAKNEGNSTQTTIDLAAKQGADTNISRPDRSEKKPGTGRSNPSTAKPSADTDKLSPSAAKQDENAGVASPNKSEKKPSIAESGSRSSATKTGANENASGLNAAKSGIAGEEPSSNTLKVDINAAKAADTDTNASQHPLAPRPTAPRSDAPQPPIKASQPTPAASKTPTSSQQPAASQSKTPQTATQAPSAAPQSVPDEIQLPPEIPPAEPKILSAAPEVPPPPLKNFTSRSFSLPSDALAIEQITVRYTGSDGVSREKIIDVNRSINWQDDFVISASAKPTLQRALDVSVTSNDPNLKNQSPLSTSSASFAPRLELPLETLKFDDGLKFVIHQNNVQIITADDFKSSDANASGALEMELWRQEIPLSGASFAVNIGGFSDINVTKEDGYYRIGVRSREGNLSIRRKDGGYLIYKN